MKTEKGKLVALKEGIYTIYVFELDIGGYIMCTKLPNWDVPNISIGIQGFFTYTEAIAGETYFNPKIDKLMKYNYTNIYFINFIEDNLQIENKEIIIV